MQRSAFPISDAPTPWLSQLVFKHLDKQSKQCILSTSKMLRDFSLGEADHVRCHMPTGSLSPEEAASSLRPLNACKKDAKITLTLKGGADNEEYSDEECASCERATAYESTSWLRSLCSHASLLPGSPLHHVTCVELQGPVLGDIVPLELIMTCPSMTHLTRTGQLISVDRLEFAPVACPQLQQLTLNGLTKPRTSAQEAITILQRQLRSLTNLQHLECDFSGEDLEEDSGVGYVVDSIQVLSHQLVFVCIVADSDVIFPKLMASPWPQLRTLRLPRQCVHEDDLELIVQGAPQLGELEVSVLMCSTSILQSQACQLQVLSVAEASLPALAVYAKGRLHTLRIGKLCIEDRHALHVEDATTQLAAWPNVMASQSGDALGLHIDVWEQDFPVQKLVPLLRLITFKSIKLSCVSNLNEEWLKLLAAVDCPILSLSTGALAQAAWATLFMQLPKLHTLELVFDYRCAPCVLSVQLCTLCMTAPRPITIQVGRRLVEYLDLGWQTILDACQQLRCRHHATIEIVDE